MRYAWIKSNAAEFAIAVMCRVLKVSQSGYYSWRSRKPSLRSVRRENILYAAARSHADSGGIYGYRKVWEDLVQAWGLACGKELVRRVMRENGQSAIDYEVAFWSKLATPLATLVMLFLSVPFVLAHSRFVSIGQRIFLGVVFGMAFYTLNRGMSYVALVYGINPVVSALIPAAAFLAIGVVMIRRVR